jgi:flagellar basal body-associated protein FliL
MVAQKRRSRIKHRRTVEGHTRVSNEAVRKAQESTTPAQTQETPTQLPQTPVVESGFPPPSIQAFPQPQPIQPQPQPITPQQTTSEAPAPLPQPASQDARLAAVPQQSKQPPVEAASPSQEFAPAKKSKLWLFVIVGFVFLVGGSGALLYFREKAVKQDPKEEKVTPPTAGKLSPTQAPVTPTVSSSSKSANLQVDYLQYAIRVLNGSGIRGEASKLKGFLEEEKFVVKDIDNADSSDYEKTVIKAKKDVPKEYLDTLETLLGKTYILDTKEELKESVDVDVVIIIGSSKKP